MFHGPRVPERLSCSQKSKNDFHNNTKMDLILLLSCICTNGTKTMANKSAGALAPIKAEAPNYTHSHFPFRMAMMKL